MRKFSSGLLPWLTVAGWLFLLTYACYLAPTTPDPQRGYTAAINNHGATHYVTPIMYYLVFFYVPVCAIAAGLIKQSKWWSIRRRDSSPTARSSQ